MDNCLNHEGEDIEVDQCMSSSGSCWEVRYHVLETYILVATLILVVLTIPVCVASLVALLHDEHLARKNKQS